MNLKAIRANNTRAFNKFPDAVVKLYELEVILQSQSKDEQVNEILSWVTVISEGVELQNEQGEFILFETTTSCMDYVKKTNGCIHRLLCGMAEGHQFIKNQPYIKYGREQFKIDENLGKEVVELMSLLKKPELIVSKISKENDENVLVVKPIPFNFNENSLTKREEKSNPSFDDIVNTVTYYSRDIFRIFILPLLQLIILFTCISVFIHNQNNELGNGKNNEIAITKSNSSITDHSLGAIKYNQTKFHAVKNSPNISHMTDQDMLEAYISRKNPNITLEAEQQLANDKN